MQSFTEIPGDTKQHNLSEKKSIPEVDRRDSPVVSWAEQEIMSSAQTEQESPH